MTNPNDCPYCAEGDQQMINVQCSNCAASFHFHLTQVAHVPTGDRIRGECPICNEPQVWTRTPEGFIAKSPYPFGRN